jgi:hypothetical protein
MPLEGPTYEWEVRNWKWKYLLVSMSPLSYTCPAVTVELSLSFVGHESLATSVEVEGLKPRSGLRNHVFLMSIRTLVSAS